MKNIKFKLVSTLAILFILFALYACSNSASNDVQNNEVSLENLN